MALPYPTSPALGNSDSDALRVRIDFPAAQTHRVVKLQKTFTAKEAIQYIVKRMSVKGDIGEYSLFIPATAATTSSDATSSASGDQAGQWVEDNVVINSLFPDDPTKENVVQLRKCPTVVVELEDGTKKTACIKPRMTSRQLIEMILMSQLSNTSYRSMRLLPLPPSASTRSNSPPTMRNASGTSAGTKRYDFSEFALLYTKNNNMFWLEDDLELLGNNSTSVHLADDDVLQIRPRPKLVKVILPNSSSKKLRYTYTSRVGEVRNLALSYVRPPLAIPERYALFLHDNGGQWLLEEFRRIVECGVTVNSVLELRYKQFPLNITLPNKDRRTVEVDFDEQIAELLPVLCAKLKISQNLSYELWEDNSEEMLNPYQSLAEQGIAIGGAVVLKKTAAPAHMEGLSRESIVFRGGSPLAGASRAEPAAANSANAVAPAAPTPASTPPSPPAATAAASLNTPPTTLEEARAQQEMRNIWDEPEDSPENIVFSKPTNSKVDSSGGSSSGSSANAAANASGTANASANGGNADAAVSTADEPMEVQTVASATLNKLVERLTSEKEPDLKFMKTFLLTYQSFTTPAVLLDKLLQRYHVPRHKFTELAASDEEFRAKFVKPIQLRVCNVLKNWLELAKWDFDQPLLDKVVEFIDKTLELDSKKTADKLKKVLKNQSTERQAKQIVFTEPPPEPKLPRNLQAPNLNIFDIDDEEIARQLTIIEYELFAAIEPTELLNQAWNKPKLYHRCPHLLAMINRFNNVSMWVATMIVKIPSLKLRAKMMAKFMAIAKHLRDLNNFSTLTAVIAGLNNSAVSRLKWTRKELPKRTVDTMAALEKLMNGEYSFREYRQVLHSLNPPCIPYMGVYLKDLTFIDENPDYIGHLINFDKCRLVYSVIMDLQQYQQKPYNLKKVPKLQEFLLNLTTASDKELYDISLQQEPRGCEKPKT